MPPSEFVCDLTVCFSRPATGAEAVLTRTVALPFAPSPGLRLVGWSGQHVLCVDRVEWDAERERFACNCDVPNRCRVGTIDEQCATMGPGWAKVSRGE